MAPKKDMCLPKNFIKKKKKGVTKAKFDESGDCVFRRNGPVLCLKWKQKKKKEGSIDA